MNYRKFYVAVSALFLSFGFALSAQAVTADYFVVSGTDNTATSSANFTVNDINDLVSSNDVRAVSDANWPMAGAFDESKYLEFVFTPNISAEAIIDAVSVTHEFRRSATLNGAKLETWDGSSWFDQTLNIPATANTDLSQDLDLISLLDTPAKINNFKVRFLAYKNTSVVTNTTSHDFVKLSVTYHLPIVTHTLTYTAGADGHLEGNLSQMVNQGENGTAVNAVADAGFHFVDWSDGSTANPRTDLNVMSDISVTANFAPDIILPGAHTILANAGSGGNISPNGAVSVTENSDQAFTIMPDLNFHILDVLIDGASVGAVSDYTFSNVTDNHTISATFALDTHLLNITAVNGAVTKNPNQASYDHGAMVELTATPVAGYLFDHWSNDASGSVNPVSITLDSDKNVTAEFVANPILPITYTITATSSAGGMIDPSGAVSVADGADQTFVITADVGFVISEVLVDSATTTATSTYTFASVIADHTISVSFSAVATSTATNTDNNDNSGGSGSRSGGGGAGLVLGAYTTSPPTLSPEQTRQLLIVLGKIREIRAARLAAAHDNLTPPALELTVATSSDNSAQLADVSQVGGNVFGRLGRWFAGLFGKLF